MGIYLAFHRKRLESRVLSRQKQSWCHSVFFAMYISGAKFEEHRSNILGDMVEPPVSDHPKCQA